MNTFDLWKENKAVIIEGNVRARNDELSISVTTATEINFNYYSSLCGENKDEKVGIRYTEPLNRVSYFEVAGNIYQ